MSLARDTAAGFKASCMLQIGMLGALSDQVVPSLIKSLDDESADVRKAAAKALGQLGTLGASAIPHLRAHLRDTSDSVSRSVAFALSDLGHDTHEAAQALIEEFGDDSMRDYVILAVGNLRWRAKPAMTRLLHFLDDASGDTRCAVATALGKVGPQNAKQFRVVPALVRHLRDESEDVRKAASTALGQLGIQASEAVPALAECLKDRSDDVCEAAAEALGEFGKEKSGDVKLVAAEALRCCLQNPNKHVVRAASLSLQMMNGVHFDPLTGKMMVSRKNDGKKSHACSV